MVEGKLKAVGLWLWDTIKPPSGVQARRVVMAFTLLVMVGRFGLLKFTSPGSAVRINVIQSWQYGVAYLALFLALCWTRSEKRSNGQRLRPRDKKGLVYGNNCSGA